MLNERNTLLEDDGIEEEILVEEECSVAQAVWGDIQGNIENQTDLKNALDAKQDSLTEAQLNAVNSGITAEKVTTYDGYADQIASKANQSALNAEATTRGEADTALGTRIDNEALARQSADNGLQSQIDAITSKSDVVDVVANYAALQAYDTSTLGNNDVVKVLDDETHEDALTYYRWSTTTQTWSYIGQEAPYYSKGQMDTKLAEKQDKLTAGANIQIQNGTISATDTTYTAGNGLNLNGTEFSADTDVLATKSDLEGYYTKPETDNLLAPKLEAEVVAGLPTTGEEGKLYLTPKAHTTQTATGNPITATVSEDAGKIESFQLDGDTFQQSYEGKNLYDIATASDVWINQSGTAQPNDVWKNSDFIKVEPNTTYTLSGSTIEDGFKQLQYHEYSSNNESSYINQYAQINGVNSTTFTTHTDCNYIRVGYRKDTLKDVQLEAGSTATTFEPYVGGVPSPSPDYPQPIQTVTGTQTVEIVGKNLFNKNDVEVGTVMTDGSFNSTYTDARTAGYAPVLPNTTYVTSGRPNGWGIQAFYTKDKTFIQRTTTTSFTTPANCYFVRLECHRLDLNIFQCELGSTVTAYEPYSKQTLPIDLGSIELCGLGDDGNGNPLYKDYIYPDGEEWKIHKATGKYVFTGEETSTWDSTIPRIYLSAGQLSAIGIYPVYPDSQTSLPYVIVSKFTTKSFRAFYTDGESNGFAMSQMGKNFNFGDKSWTQKSDGQADMNGAIVYYALDTDHTTDTVITDTDLIAQLEAIRTASLETGANTITNTATGTNLAGDMEIGYYGFAPRNRYDKWLWLDINNEYEQIGS